MPPPIRTNQNKREGCMIVPGAALPARRELRVVASDLELNLTDAIRAKALPACPFRRRTPKV
jgi:hypothetical protein